MAAAGPAGPEQGEAAAAIVCATARDLRWGAPAARGVRGPAKAGAEAGRG